MSIINYELKKIADCKMRGEDGKIRAGWFYLTDSYYHLQLGDTKIFEYNGEAVKKFKLTNSYLDYYFIRLLEDIFEVLEETIRPIPKEVYAYFDTNEKYDRLNTSLNDWYWGIKDSFEYFVDVFDRHINREPLPEPPKKKKKVLELLGNDLIWCGGLNVSFLIDGPICRFVHVEDELHIHYDCTRYGEKNNWTAQSGVFKMPYQSFIDEVAILLESFFADMERQICEAAKTFSEDEYVYNYYPADYIKKFPEVLQQPKKKGADILWEEQEKRKSEFTTKLKKAQTGIVDKPLDWEKVILHIRQFAK